ncbi:MAG: hypothetical protein QOH96_1454 [Blastocatellia bacterium]|nr:hypothetical protein [Blastocatellia bacterium]
MIEEVRQFQPFTDRFAGVVPADISRCHPRYSTARDMLWVLMAIHPHEGNCLNPSITLVFNGFTKMIHVASETGPGIALGLGTECLKPGWWR